MSKLPSYEELQKRVAYLEKKIYGSGPPPGKLMDTSQHLFFEICEYSKNSIAVFETNDNGKTFIIKYFNKKAEETEAIQREKIIGKSLEKLFPSVINSGFLDALRRVFVTHNPEEFPAIKFSSGKIIEWKQNYIYKSTGHEIVSIYTDETEHRSKELELFEHRKKLEIAMEAANYYSFEIDFKTGKISTNKELYIDLGYTGQEIEGLMQKTGSLIHPEDFKIAEKLISEHSQKLKPSLKTEFRIKHKTGKWFWFSANGKIIERDKESKPLRFVGLVRNVQEEKELFLKLQDSEEKFKSLATLLPEVVYETDVHGNITFVNLKAFDIFEYTPEELKNGLNIVQMLAPEEIERAKKNLEQIVKLDHVLGEEYIAITKSGKRFPILVYTSTIKEKSSITGLRGIIVNISELKKAQEKLQNSEEIFNQLSENINDAFWLRTLDDKVLYANPACYKIVGDNFKEVFENFNLYKQWIHPGDRKKIIAQRKKNVKYPHKVHLYEHRIINHKGEVRWLWIRTFPVINSQGKIYRRAGIASDITSQKNLLADLLIAKQKAEDSDRLKSAFLANMSHEIRTPMNGILGFTELLKDESITAQDKMNYLKIIDSNGKQLLNLINDIIDIAKIEAGQLILNKTVSEVGPLLEEMFEIFKEEQKRLKKENIDFRLKVQHNTDNIIFTDTSRLKQVFLNLLSNAFKFTESGSITFGYDIITAHGTKYYRFFVSDTGPGIPDKMLNYIFERFGQLQPQKYKNQQGTGLGLAISKGLIELLNGKIWVESTLENLVEKKPGHSTFYFTIPINNLPNYNPNKTNLNSQLTMKKFENLDILVVEDNEDNLEFLRRLLEKSGASVVVAKTGEEAIEAVKSNSQIKIVLMDIRLPDINGFETAQKIKALKPGLPVIAQTAYAMYNDREICLENGCDDYMSKPLNKEILFEKINHYIYN